MNTNAQRHTIKDQFTVSKLFTMVLIIPQEYRRNRLKTNSRIQRTNYWYCFMGKQRGFYLFIYSFPPADNSESGHVHL